MSKKKQKINKSLKELLIYISIMIILLITFTNIINYAKPKKVLGLKTESLETLSLTKREQYFKDILQNNPNYLPAWKELGRMDKVNEIDPNYITP